MMDMAGQLLEMMQYAVSARVELVWTSDRLWLRSDDVPYEVRWRYDAPCPSGVPVRTISAAPTIGQRSVGIWKRRG